jgi:hypothetical protein
MSETALPVIRSTIQELFQMSKKIKDFRLTAKAEDYNFCRADFTDIFLDVRLG